MVVNASLSDPPTTGTKLEMENFTARVPNVSAAPPAKLCNESKPENNIIPKVSIHAAALPNHLPTPPNFICGVTGKAFDYENGGEYVSFALNDVYYMVAYLDGSMCINIY